MFEPQGQAAPPTLSESVQARACTHCLLPFAYSCYGLHLASDRALPGLPTATDDNRQPRIAVEFEPDAERSLHAQFSPWYTSDILDEHGNSALTIWRDRNSGDYSIRYSHGLMFELDAALCRIAIRRLQPLSDEDVTSFLLGPILGVLLRLRGVICLHAGAVTLGEKAIAIAGIEGAGKSTTAAMFAREGAAVLSDDIVALREKAEEFEALPGYSFLNLWPDSAEIVKAAPSAISIASPECEKLRLRLDENGGKFQREPLRISAIYILGKRSEYAKAPFLEKLEKQTALMQLVTHTYGNRLLDARRRADEFEVLGRLVKSVPVWQVTPHASPDRLPEMLEKIRASCGSARAHSAAG